MDDSSPSLEPEEVEEASGGQPENLPEQHQQMADIDENLPQKPTMEADLLEVTQPEADTKPKEGGSLLRT